MNQNKKQNHPFIDHLKAMYRRGIQRGAAIGTRLRHTYTLKRLGIVAAACAGLTLVVMTAFFLWPRKVELSFSGTTCVQAPTFLPSLTSAQSSDAYKIEPVASLRIGKTALFARTACIGVKAPPKEHASEQVQLALPGATMFKKTVTVHTTAFPSLAQPLPAKPLSTKAPLDVRLNTADSLFTYTIGANGQAAPCTVQGQMLKCDLPALKLAQAAAYDLTIVRALNKQNAGQLTQQRISTVEPIRVTSTSIGAGQLVHNAPTEVALQLNKPAVNPKDIRLENRSASPVQALPIDTRQIGDVITITFKQPLPRSTALAVVVPALEAADGAYLETPYELPFTTSGGPKVRSISIGSAKVNPDATFTLTFDSNIASGQNLAAFIKVEGAAGGVSAITSQGNRITVKTSGQGRCMPLTVKVLDGLKNEHGISGGSAWQFRSRTLCQTVFSIGASVHGRSITAYRFGSGANKIIFVGGIHGDERSSVQILNRWIDQLEINADRIPAHQTIIVIPNANPDGYAANTRVNANGVDLNRNFPANNWKSGVTMPNKSFAPTGGGTAPLSEPESRALANYISGQQPRLVLTYHASGSIVQPNGAGDSAPIGVEYANKSIVGYLSPGQTPFWDYDTTGAMEDWLNDRLGRAALVIELATRTSNDYNGHQKALWYIAGL